MSGFFVASYIQCSYTFNTTDEYQVVKKLSCFHVKADSVYIVSYTVLLPA